MFRNALLLCFLPAAWSFQPALRPRTSIRPSKLNMQEFDPAFDKVVRKEFPKAISNKQLEESVINALTKKGYEGPNTLLATSLCCDELARSLEDDFLAFFGKNFNLGGLGMYEYAGINISGFLMKGMK